MAEEKLPSYPDVEKTLVHEKDGQPPAQVLKHAIDADEAMKAFEGHDGELLVLDEATNKRLLRKIDRNILPVGVAHGYCNSSLLMEVQLLCVVYGLNYLDSMASTLPASWFDMRQKQPCHMPV